MNIIINLNQFKISNRIKDSKIIYYHFQFQCNLCERDNCNIFLNLSNVGLG